MKALKIIGVIIGVLGLAAAGFWFFMLRHPSPEAVCDHIVELTKKEVGDKGAAAKLDAVKAKCVEQLQAPEYGMLSYAKQMKCAMSAETLAEVASCGS